MYVSLPHKNSLYNQPKRFSSITTTRAVYTISQKATKVFQMPATFPLLTKINRVQGLFELNDIVFENCSITILCKAKRYKTVI